MAMIYQLLRGNGQPLPYFVIEPLNSRPHRSACLTPGYVYPCSNHCRGLSVPWQTATAVAPMILLDLARQLAQDVAEFSPIPHARLDAQESEQWRQLYHAITTYNSEEPQNVTTRDELRRLHRLAINRQNYYARLHRLAPAPPGPKPGPPKPGPPDPEMPNPGMLST